MLLTLRDRGEKSNSHKMAFQPTHIFIALNLLLCSCVAAYVEQPLTPASTISQKLIKPWPMPFVDCHGDYRDQTFLEKHIGGPMYSNQDKLPKLPIPSIKHTIEKFLPTALPLAESLAEKEALVKACEAFPNQAKKLQERLYKRQEEMENSSWLQKWWNELLYLQYRDPVAMYVSYFLELEDDPTLKYNEEGDDDSMVMLQRGALALHAAAEFRNLIASGTLEPETLGRHETPLDMTAYKYMFNSCRIPKPVSDHYRLYDPSRFNHAIVACRGRFFKIELFDPQSQDPLPLPVIENQLMKCMEKALDGVGTSHNNVELGWLTTNHRDKWSEDRQKLLNLGGSEMKDALHTLESSALMLCLDDDECPMSFEQCAQEYWCGSGANRWFDKSVQLVCTENGKLGYIGEHAMMDGMAAVTLCNHILEDKYADKASKSALHDEEETSSAAHLPPVTDIFEKVWPTFSKEDMEDVEGMVNEAKEEFNKLVADHELRVVNFEQYGSNFIKKAGYSPDAYMQMAIQLVAYRLFGKQVGTYEATQVRPFRHGRTETTRSVTEDSSNFVKFMDATKSAPVNDDNAVKAKKVDLLKKATETHKKYTIDACQGLGVDRHLFGLSMAVNEKDGDADEVATPDLFSDPLFVRSKTWRLSTSTVPHPLGFGEVVPDGVGVGYIVRPDSCLFTVTSRKEPHYADRLCELLEGSLLEMQTIHDGNDDGADDDSEKLPQSKL